MKTTIEISDGLMRQVKSLAQRKGTTIRALIEAGLQVVLREHRDADRARFALRDASFGGQGLTQDAQGKSWDELRDAIYDGRGS